MRASDLLIWTDWNILAESAPLSIIFHSLVNNYRQQILIVFGLSDN